MCVRVSKYILVCILYVLRMQYLCMQECVRVCVRACVRESAEEQISGVYNPLTA